MTYAESKLEAIAILNSSGLIVRDVVVLIDRDQGGSEQLKKHGYSCHSALGLRDLIEFYYGSKMISYEYYTRTRKYLEFADFGSYPFAS